MTTPTTISSPLHPVLSQKYHHPRDDHIDFDEPTHTYTITHPDQPHPEIPYTSVTTWIHHHFPKFDADAVIQKMMKGRNWNSKNKYWGMTPEQIKEQWTQNGKNVTGSGTELHYEIECFMNNPDSSLPEYYNHQDLWKHYLQQQQEQQHATTPQIRQSTEWKYFLQYIQDHPELKPYRTEWTIYHEELKIAGSIDMIYENPKDGSLMIYDWKRVKEIKRFNGFNQFATTYSISHLHDSNFWHYALQLNTYKAILEDKYGKKITDLKLVILHPENEEQNYELVQLPDLSREMKELFEERRKEIENDHHLHES